MAERDLSPKHAHASRVELARIITHLDANSLGNAHGGNVMKEIDNAGGIAAARHAGTVCVTASIDELGFLAPVHVGEILVVKAQVNAVGETSLEVGVRVEAEHTRTGERRHTTSAYLVFVALDDEGRPTKVPPLIADTPEEARRQAQAEIRRQIRKERIDRLGAYKPDKPEVDG